MPVHRQMRLLPSSRHAAGMPVAGKTVYRKKVGRCTINIFRTPDLDGYMLQVSGGWQHGSPVATEWLHTNLRKARADAARTTKGLGATTG